MLKILPVFFNGIYAIFQLIESSLKVYPITCFSLCANLLQFLKSAPFSCKRYVFSFLTFIFVGIVIIVILAHFVVRIIVVVVIV